MVLMDEYTMKKCECLAYLNDWNLWQREGNGNDDDDGHGGDNKKNNDQEWWQLFL